MDLVQLWFFGLLLYSLWLGLSLRVAWFGFELVLSFMHYLLPVNAVILAVSLLLAQTASNYWAVAVFALANLPWLAHVAGWAWSKPPAGQASFNIKARIGFMNVLKSNRRYHDIGRRIKQLGLDVVGLAEMSVGAFEAVKSASELEHGYVTSGWNADSGEELAILSRWPITEAGAPGSEPGRPLAAAVATPNGPLRVMVLHPYPPLAPSALKRRNQAFVRAAAAARATPEPVVIMGDFNTVPWAPALRMMQQQLPGHYQAGRGGGVYRTWGWGPLRLPIDYLWLPLGASSSGLRPDRFLGSDHRLIWAETGVDPASKIEN
ncbi:endonuclease/exonuclease/phosphatase family protein [Candidatus Parcubacteria bacterium]|nr:endonuclease/exonuclease/phosphatase family protein [Candidatus Parcubacteria bacterium]